MKLKKWLLLIIIFSICVFSEVAAQSHYVKLSGGVISDFVIFNKSNNPMFYPELDLGGKLFTKGLQWELGLGYWDDGVTEHIPGNEGGTYNYSGYISSLRLKLVPRGFDEDFNVPLKLFGGISYHYIKAKGLFDGNPTTLDYYDHEEEVFYYDLGLELYFPVFTYFTLVPKFLVFIPADKHDTISNEIRTSFSAGLEYGF